MTKKILFVLPALLFAGAACLSGCEEIESTESDDGIIHVSDVKLNVESTYQLMRTATFQLEVTVYPEDAENKSYSWINTNPDVATVTEDGLIEALNVGETIIGVQTEDKGKRGLVALRVTKYIAPNPITQVDFGMTEHVFASIADDPYQITPSIKPANPTYSKLIWSSSNPSCCVVDDNGKVTIVGGGETVISAETMDGSDIVTKCRFVVPGTAVKDRNYDLTTEINANGYYKKIYEPVEIKVPVLDADRKYVGDTIQVWLDRNLGAEQRATSFDDYKSFGSMFQWSRKADGHEQIIWTDATTTGATSVYPAVKQQAEKRSDAGTPSFLMGTSDWCKEGIGLWGGPYNISITDANYSKYYSQIIIHEPQDSPSQENNPCPYGYRIPTVMEMTQFFMAAAGVTSGNFNASVNYKGVLDTAAGAPFYVSIPGNRAYSNGSFTNTATSLFFWINSGTGANAWQEYVVKSSGATRTRGINRAYGCPIRCIKDDVKLADDEDEE